MNVSIPHVESRNILEMSSEKKYDHIKNEKVVNRNTKIIRNKLAYHMDTNIHLIPSSELST